MVIISLYPSGNGDYWQWTIFNTTYTWLITLGIFFLPGSSSGLGLVLRWSDRVAPQPGLLGCWQKELAPCEANQLHLSYTRIWMICKLNMYNIYIYMYICTYITITIWDFSTLLGIVIRIWDFWSLLTEMRTKVCFHTPKRPMCFFDPPD